MIADVDLPVDLASIIPVLNIMKYAGHFDPQIVIPERTLTFIEATGLQSITETG